MQGMDMKKSKAQLIRNAITIPLKAPWLNVIYRVAPREHTSHRGERYCRVPYVFCSKETVNILVKRKVVQTGLDRC
eukprot:scaffold767_cov144-Skeletonema_marinoi.AAC.2